MELNPDIYADCELRWQMYTKAGNQRMQANLYQEAQQAYTRALELACLLLEETKSNTIHADAIHPYVVSCHNLMDSWLSLGNVEQAEVILKQAYTQVVQMMTDENLPDLIRLEAFQALKLVSFEMDAFYRKQGQADQAEKLFAQASQLAQDFLTQLEFLQTIGRDNVQNSSCS
jgi:tetratricopeptide (TPR) repeat protein